MERHESVDRDDAYFSNPLHQVNANPAKIRSKLSAISIKSPLQMKSISSKKKSTIKSKNFPQSDYHILVQNQENGKTPTLPSIFVDA